MNKTLVIGASGKIGRMVVERLHAENKSVVAMVRSQNKTQMFADKGIEVIVGNLGEAFEVSFAGCDKVVFTAGSGAGTGAEETLLIDLWGACKVIDIARHDDVQHFVMVSSRGADNPDNGPQPIKPYLVAKHFADKHLVNSGLNYTILRPGQLNDEVGTGLVKTERPENPELQIISRADTADAIHYCLHNKSTINKTIELYRGSIPIEQAMSNVS
ncbi:SDR family oxidoreductase [Aliikangiella coralliicola]|uniref:SDR family oxidoreductase n=1 Tax=Aliikangiella coralliicola TaxID=2592383 RepID=A0A545UED3_9GAMM|nr:SDR family oxidoreductase [Aliikangiella coralliicola]TQV87743.1 SDR family oxidoreductase [Aliikangiella coralliicola]